MGVAFIMIFVFVIAVYLVVVITQKNKLFNGEYKTIFNYMMIAINVILIPIAFLINRSSISESVQENMLYTIATVVALIATYYFVYLVLCSFRLILRVKESKTELEPQLVEGYLCILSLVISSINIYFLGVICLSLD